MYRDASGNIFIRILSDIQQDFIAILSGFYLVLIGWIIIGITKYHMSLEQKDLELIERIIYKSSDDIAVSISRSFERLEERIDASESRIYSRLAELEDTIVANGLTILD